MRRHAGAMGMVRCRGSKFHQAPVWGGLALASHAQCIAAGKSRLSSTSSTAAACPQRGRCRCPCRVCMVDCPSRASPAANPLRRAAVRTTPNASTWWRMALQCERDKRQQCACARFAAVYSFCFG